MAHRLHSSLRDNAGHGVLGWIDGKHAAIGNINMLKREQIKFDLAYVDNIVETWGAKGKWLIMHL